MLHLNTICGITFDNFFRYGNAAITLLMHVLRCMMCVVFGIAKNLSICRIRPENVYKMVADNIKACLEKAGQQHILQFWDELDSETQKHLSEQMEAIDFDKINEYFR